MSRYKQFITASFIVILGSFIFGFILVLPSPFDSVQAYKKVTDPSVFVLDATSIQLLTPTSTQALSVATEAKPYSTLTSQIATSEDTATSEPEVLQSAKVEEKIEEKRTIPSVPFFSQFNDITSASWKKVGCGITSLAMLIEFYKPGALTSVDALLQEGIDAHAYLDDAGWTYAGLIAVSEKYGLTGQTHDYKNSSMDTAFELFKEDLKDGPIMASVHYTFEPTNPIPHLVIINKITDDTVFYNDPAGETGGGSISTTKFKNAWKKRYIEFYPAS